MSLVFGLHLLRKLYLVSDTRVTQKKGGSKSHKDNQLKFEALGPKISVVVAGDGHQAAFVVSKLKKAFKNKTISDLKSFLKKNANKVASEYISKFNNPSSSVFIFTGFKENIGKRINSSRLGKVMSESVKKHGSMQQSIDKEITSTLVAAIMQKGVLKKDVEIDVQVRDSEMFALEFDTKKGDIKLKEIDCYNYLMFHPGYQTQQLPIPDELISLLEFRNVSGNSVEDILYRDAEILISFVSRVARENSFDSVGGHIIPILQSFDSGVLFPTGDMGSIKNGKIVDAGSVYVEKNEICYKLPNGTKGPYKKLESLLKLKTKIEVEL